VIALEHSHAVTFAREEVGATEANDAAAADNDVFRRSHRISTGENGFRVSSFQPRSFRQS
jgi:hypothetical protein